MKTAVLVGKFSGELNYIRDGLVAVNPEIRFLSFLDNSDILAILKKETLQPDFVLVDESVQPASCLDVINTLRSIPSTHHIPILVYYRNPTALTEHLATLEATHIFRRSPVKKEYVLMFERLIPSLRQAPVGVAK